MAQLPADRTKLQAAVINQQPSIVASAKANREALTEIYDTADLLYQFVTGLVSSTALVNLTLPRNSKNNSNLITDFPIGISVMRFDATSGPLAFPVSAGTLVTHRPESSANGFQTVVNTGGGTWIYTRKNPNGVFCDWGQTVTKLNGVIQGPIDINGSKIRVSGPWTALQLFSDVGTGTELDMLVAGIRRSLISTNDTETYFRRYASDGTTIESNIRFQSDRLILNGTDLFRRSTSPEGNQTAAAGSLCVVWSTTDAGLWIKATGTGNTGWRKAAYV